jgi:iron complex outermembrane receptor protein
MRNAILFIALLITSSSFAQFNISGKVSTSDGQDLPGASIILSDKQSITVSNDKGNYILSNIKAGVHQLRVSFIGYKSNIQTVEISSDLNLDIVLEEEAILTDAVFVYATRAGSTTPVTSSTVDKVQLEKQNLGQDIPYLLNTTPSFVSSSDAGAGIGYTGFRIRGTDANRINVTINGVPVNDAESHGLYWVNMPDFSSSIENIQVQRGVGTSTNGAAAFGATINMQTNTLNKKAYAEYSGATGSFNTIKNTVRIGTGIINDHFSFDARLSKIISDGYIDRASTDLKSFFVSGGYYDTNTIVKLNVFSGKEKTYQAWNGVPSVRLNDDLAGMQQYGDHWLISEKETQEMIDSDSRTYNIYTYENETDNYQQDHFQLLLSHQFSEYINFNTALHYTKGSGYYEQYKEDEDLADYGLEDVVIGSDTITSSTLIRQKWLDNDFYGATFSLTYNKDKSDITLGGGLNKYEGDHFGNIIWAEYASNGEKDYEWYSNKGTKTDFNIYAKYNFSLSDQVNLYADMQYRTIGYSIDGVDDDLSDITQDHNFNFFNPKLGVYFQANENTKAYLSWAVGHREPSRGNFIDANSSDLTPTFETLNDFEAGYNFQNSVLSAGANIYYMLYQDQLILTGKINDVGDPIMTNVDDSYRLGIELIAGAKILSNLNWEGNATISQNKISNYTEYVDNWDEWGEQEETDLGETNIAFSPSLIANSQFNYEPIENLILSLISQYVSDQYIDNSSSDDRKLDAYFVNNINASYTFNPGIFSEVEIHLLINNILNEEYETNAWVYSYILGGERYKMDGYFPQAGTNFMIGLNIKF